MPIEIKELHIKIHVDEGASQGGRRDAATNAKVTDTTAVVEEIMELIRLQKER
jgi:hypothetical protein